jgi:glycerol dehydrogenase-like iron-containing ADH family enzyme
VNVSALPVQISIEQDAIPPLLDFCQERDYRRFILVCDHNTFAALGGRVEAALESMGADVRTARVDDDLPGEVIADEVHLVQAIAAAVPAPQALAELLGRAGGTADPHALGLSLAEVDEAFHSAHYLRDRFTVARLWRILETG